MPNTTVYVNYWVVSACYPRGNFYPLSDDHSILNRLITKPCFRTCLTCRSRSQSPLYLYALRMISIHSEGNFGRLRYSLGGDRPSQTVHQTLSLYQIHGTRLEIQFIKGGIPRLTPPKLASRSHSLPPILYITNRIPISSYSKAPRGLSETVPRSLHLSCGSELT